jgi:hypothetical protein
MAPFYRFGWSSEVSGFTRHGCAQKSQTKSQ